MPARPYCVIDTKVVILANLRLRKHVSPAQKARYQLLLQAAKGNILLLQNQVLDHEYVAQLSGRPLSDLTKAFIQVLDREGRTNSVPLRHGERSRLRKCRFPVHDEHLLKAAKNVPGAVIVTEDDTLLKAASCVQSTLGYRILSPRAALTWWGLP